MIAIDPGPTDSAFVVMSNGHILEFGIVPTMQLVDRLANSKNHSHSGRNRTGKQDAQDSLSYADSPGNEKGEKSSHI